MTVEPTLLAAYDGLVCDLDGVVYRGPAPVEHAVSTLADVGTPIQYATNNAARSPNEVAAHLRGLGLRVATDDVATSAQAAADLIASQLVPGARVMAVGGPGVAAALDAAGLTTVQPGEGSVEAVLQGYGPDVSARVLAEAAYAVQSGATWVATNEDLTLPTERGTAPGNGALVLAVATACGRPPDQVVGKPYAALYQLCARRLGVAPDRVLAIGDRLDTDIAGAVAAGMDSLLVLTGVSSLSDAVAAEPSMRPTFVAPDLRVLLEPRSVVAGGLTERLRTAYRAIDTGEITVRQARLLVAGAEVQG